MHKRLHLIRLCRLLFFGCTAPAMFRREPRGSDAGGPRGSGSATGSGGAATASVVGPRAAAPRAPVAASAPVAGPVRGREAVRRAVVRREPAAVSEGPALAVGWASAVRPP